MGKTLVLAVDRDDDFGVKGNVITPVIGIHDCIDAANALGIADPEDSDLNALYMAVSVCKELIEDDTDAEVALICGDSKVGHKSDLELVNQLHTVLDKVNPESVVLVGDGAEDEYIYPIIASRTSVDSVKKVYVKQAPGLEGSFYILSRMLSDPEKRKRFLAPIGIVLILIALVYMFPVFLAYFSQHDVSILSQLSGSLTVSLIGLAVLMYSYQVVDRMAGYNAYLRTTILQNSTRIILSVLAFLIFVVSLFTVISDMGNIYFIGWASQLLYVVSGLIWPLVIALILYVLGFALEEFQSQRTIHLSTVFSCFILGNIGLVAIGVVDILQWLVGSLMALDLGVAEVVAGIVLSIIISYLRARLSPPKEVVPDELF